MARRWRLGAWTAVLLAVSACRAAPSEHVDLGMSMDALRSAFTADSGKVRAIFLASPT